MAPDNESTQECLIKIYEQNQQILDLLRKFIDSFAPIGHPVDEEKKTNVEKISCLSPREREIISLVLEGKLNKQIAYDLTISVSTVEYHRSNIMRKLDAKNIGQMIKMYLQWEGTI